MIDVNNRISPEDKIENSKAYLLFNLPMYGLPVNRLVWKIDNSISTACTDGKHIYWNEKFFDSLFKPESTGVSMHEVLHVIFEHPSQLARFLKKYPQYSTPFYNQFIQMSMDFEINFIIFDMKSKFIKLPDGACFDEQYRGMVWQEIFFKLIKDVTPPKDEEPDEIVNTGGSGTCEGDGDQQSDVGNHEVDDQGTSEGGDGDDQNGSGDDQEGGSGNQQSDDDQSSSGNTGSPSGADQSVDTGGCGGVIVPKNDDGSDLSEPQLEQMEKETRIMVRNSIQLAKKKGNDIPSQVMDAFNENRKAKVDWLSVLRKHTAPIFRSDQTYSKLNKRLRPLGYKMPSYKKDGTGEIVICNDTSGSMTANEVEQSNTETYKIVSKVKPKKVTIHYFHTSVWCTQTYKTGEKFKMPSHFETGGTDFQAFMDKVNEQNAKPKVMIVFTDMYDRYPPKPSFPVIWISTTKDRVAPYGKTIYLDPSELKGVA